MTNTTMDYERDGGGASYDDYGYEDAAPTVASGPPEASSESEIHEPHAPTHGSSLTDGSAARRGSMSEIAEQNRRASIKTIMADKTITPLERRRSIQFLMDGRRNSMGTCPSGMSSINNGGRPMTAEDMAQVAIRTVKDQIGGEAAAAAAKAKHPYNAATTPVPAVAAGATDPRHHHLHRHHPPGSAAAAAELMSSKRAELSRPACEHYRRNCTLVAPCCGAAFGCRICHDDSPVLPPVLAEYGAQPTPEPVAGETFGAGGARAARSAVQRSSSMPANFTDMSEPQHHTVDRFAIKEVICRRCYTRQSSKTNNCVNCDVQFGEYHCAICNLWMDNAERPYHCADCGFCRVGGAENFRHCHDCGMCIDANLFREHNCKVGKYMQNCPVCQEDLFSSRSASHEMPCGHAIHWHCFRELAAHDSRCPVCKKTAETHSRMAPTWNAMAMGIELQPVPPDLAKVVTIICNDCEKTDENRSWHFLGVQCRNCTSFNTVVEKIQSVGPEAHAFLEQHDPHPASPEGRRRSLAERRLEEATVARARAYPDEEMPSPEEQAQAEAQAEQAQAHQEAQQQAQAQAQQQAQPQLAAGQQQRDHSQSDNVADAQVRAMRRIRRQEEAEAQARDEGHSASLPPREAQTYDREAQMRDLYRQQMRREEAMRQALLEEQRNRRREQQREAARMQAQYLAQQRAQHEEQERYELEMRAQQEHQQQQAQAQVQQQAQQQQPQGRSRFGRRNSSTGATGGGGGGPLSWMGLGQGGGNGGGQGQGQNRRRSQRRGSAHHASSAPPAMAVQQQQMQQQQYQSQEEQRYQQQQRGYGDDEHMQH